MQILLAQPSQTKQVQNFFKKYLNKNSPWITNEEFLCPFGVSANIKKWQVMLVQDGEKILGALRFYPRKREKIVSVYQFALDESIRGKWFIKKILEQISKKTWYNIFESNCFLDDSFNDYYKKTWWILKKSDEKFNYWEMEI